jgi:transposase-like protein
MSPGCNHVVGGAQAIMHFREMADADFAERVALKHIADGMPIIELHRNHGVPLTAVRKWIALYREGGRSSVVAYATAIAVKLTKPCTPSELARVRERLLGDKKTAHQAIITIAVRHIHALVPELLHVLRSGANGSNDIAVILTLRDLNAHEALAEAKQIVRPGLEVWF